MLKDDKSYPFIKITTRLSSFNYFTRQVTGLYPHPDATLKRLTIGPIFLFEMYQPTP